MAGVALIARGLKELLNPNQIQELIRELVPFENSLCVCSWMNPSLWSPNLLDELVQLVFARLPLPNIIQLRTLSTERDERFTSVDTEFMLACSEAQPPMFAIVAEGHDHGLISVRLFDTKSNSWYSFIEPMLDEHCVTMCTGDGGLICMVPAAINKEEDPLVIIVLNPLTRKWRKLTPHALSQVQPTMVQLVMDEEGYKVIVVGERKQLRGTIQAGPQRFTLLKRKLGVMPRPIQTSYLGINIVGIRHMYMEVIGLVFWKKLSLVLVPMTVQNVGL